MKLNELGGFFSKKLFKTCVACEVEYTRSSSRILIRHLSLHIDAKDDALPDLNADCTELYGASAGTVGPTNKNRDNSKAIIIQLCCFRP